MDLHGQTTGNINLSAGHSGGAVAALHRLPYSPIESFLSLGT